MANFKLNPQSGTISDSKNISFELTNLQIDKIRFSIENTTNATKANIKEIKRTGDLLKGVVDLNISETASQSSISIFAVLEEELSNGIFKLCQVFPVIYHIEQKKVEFKDKININPTYININEITALQVSSKPDNKITFSINDKRLSVITNKEGNGSIHFRGRDILSTSDVQSIQKFPIYAYSIDTNYNKKEFTGLTLNILPSNIKSQAVIGEIDPRCLLNEPWVLPEDCKKHPPQELNPDIVPQIPNNGLPVKNCDYETCTSQTNEPIPCTNCENIKVTVDNVVTTTTPTPKVCNITSSSFTLTNNGMVLHSYISVDKTKKNGQIGYNIGRVFITKDQSSLDKPVMSVQNATINPHKAPGDAFEILIDKVSAIFIKEMILDMGKTIRAVIFDSRTAAVSLKISSVIYDEYLNNYILTTETNSIIDIIEETLYCQYVVFYDDTSSVTPSINLGATSPLPYITGENDIPISAIRSTIICNANFIPDIETDPYLITPYFNESSIDGVLINARRWTPVYIIAEAEVMGRIQLFLYSLAYEPSVNNDLSYGWQQLTFDGENKNAKAVIDNFNNIHICWESNRAGGMDYQLYYGVVGPSAISSCNMALSSIVDKQAEFNFSSKPDYYMSHDILVYGNEYNASAEEIEKAWETYTTGEAKATINTETSLDIQTNPTNDMAIAMTRIYQPNDPFEQFNFQISFNVCPLLSQIKYPQPENQRYFTFGSLVEGDYGLSYFYRQWILEGDFPYVTTYQESGTLWASLVDGDFGVGLLYRLSLMEGDYIGISSFSPGDYTAYERTLNESVKNAIYTNWKSQFVLNVEKSFINSPIYTYSDNDFTIGVEYSIYDRFIPMVGAYKIDSLTNFQVVASGDSTLKPFMIGIIPEKMRMKASNILDKVTYDEINEIGESGESKYVSNYEREIYTGNSKLVFIYNSYKTKDSNSSVIIRNICDNFPIWATTKLDVIVHYSKMFSEDIASYYDLQDISTVTSSKFVCSVTILKNASSENCSPMFSESFITDLGDEHNSFDIGFGVPYGGQYLADEYVPYNSSIFENNNIVLQFTDISLTPPLYTYNTNIITLPDYVLYPYSLYVQNTIMTGGLNDSTSFYETEWALFPGKLSMGLEATSFPQIPITLAGNNKSADICLGIGNDIHIAWQSNRDRFWNIYTTNSDEKNLPFRKETQITNTKNNSLCPSIKVNNTGKRMIVWHDDRNGKYEVFAARAFNGYASKKEICSSSGIDTTPIVCSIDTDFILAQGGWVIFDMDFYYDNKSMSLYKKISTKDSRAGWKINGVDMSKSYQFSGNNNEIEGVLIEALTPYSISYTPSSADNVFDKVLYCKLVYNILVE